MDRIYIIKLHDSKHSKNIDQESIEAILNEFFEKEGLKVKFSTGYIQYKRGN